MDAGPRGTEESRGKFRTHGVAVRAGVATIVALMLVNHQLETKGEKDNAGIDLVVGPRAVRCNWCCRPCITSIFQRAIFPAKTRNASRNCRW